MPRINVLPKNIAELISAGEVVERPSSVVKELVENAIDAGSSSITVEIQNGGISFIRVTDNGCGILHDDVPKAFLSHATSKIGNKDDLNSIFTLGFRGEALSSICAVSKVQLLTKSPDENEGTSYRIEGGIEKEYDSAGCPNGTTFIVRDIFYNVPARMKFLKKPVSEGNAVADIVDKLALSRPDISFRFIRDSKQIILTPGDGKLLSCVYSVFGSDFAKSLIEARGEMNGIKVSGLVSKPVESRASRAMQFFFINGRYVKSRSLTGSFENAYKNSLMVGKFPACVLNVEIPYDSVDVNVHPTKTEVRFSDERAITSSVYYAVKSTVQASDTTPSFDLGKLTASPEIVSEQISFNAEKNPSEINETHYKKTVIPDSKFWQSSKASSVRVSDVSLTSSAGSDDEPDLIGDVSAYASHKIPESFQKSHSDEANTEIIDKKSEFDFKYIGEAFKTYLIIEFNGKLCFIDKHAAHERILFNELKKRHSKEASQVLLEPVLVTLSKNEYDIVLGNTREFLEAGFFIDDFGDGVVAVRQKPTVLDDDDIFDSVIESARNLYEGKVDAFSDKLDMILHTTACKAAIKAGNKNSPTELELLAKEVCFNEEVRYCPHGRPVIIELSKYDFEKQFRRIQN